MKPYICFGICFSSKRVHLRLKFFLFSNLGLIIVQQASIHISCLMAGGWHTSRSPISKMHIVGEGPGETPSVLRCLIWLTAFGKYKTADERLAGGHSFCPILMSVSEAFSIFFLLQQNFITQKLWATTPCHWPWIEFLSSVDQESRSLSLLNDDFHSSI